MRRLALLPVATLLAACTGPGYRDPEDSERMHADIEDRNIATRVRIALGEDPETARYEEIRVTCRNRVVTLRGEVDRESAKERAVRVARGCEGVGKIIDQITVGRSRPD